MVGSSHRFTFPLLLLLIMAGTFSLPPRAIALPQRAEALVAQNRRILPPALIDTLKQDVHRRTNLPVQQIRVVSAQPETWPDGCLGLAQPDQMCSQALVEGWRVVLGHGKQRWLYRTDQSGRTYRLQSSTLHKPQQSSESFTWIPEAELPPQLQPNQLFRVITSGGFAGRTTQVTLMRDGRMVRTQLAANGRASQPQVHQISVDQLRQFQAILRQHSLRPFHRHAYPAPVGSADVQAITVSSRSGTVRYAETQQQDLPPDLQLVVQAWQDL